MKFSRKLEFLSNMTEIHDAAMMQQLITNIEKNTHETRSDNYCEEVRKEA